MNSNTLTHTIEFGNFPINNNIHKKIEFTGNNINNNKALNKSNSVINYKRYCNNTGKPSNIKTPIIRNRNHSSIFDRRNNTIDFSINNDNDINNINNNINNKKKYNYNNNINNKKKHNNMIKKFISNKRPKKDETKLKIKKDYYCINCYNRKLLPLNNTKIPFKNMNKSYDANYYHKTLELKKLDEDYINNKVLQNQKKQLRAFNNLKEENNKNPKTKKEKLQYINENEDNPFIGLNLQDYLYYNNKKNNEILNNTIIDNINTYKVDKPRKAISDYYNNVQYQIPVLEKNK